MPVSAPGHKLGGPWVGLEFIIQCFYSHHVKAPSERPLEYSESAISDGRYRVKDFNKL